MGKSRFPSFPNFPVGHSFADAFDCWVFFFSLLLLLTQPSVEGPGAPELLVKPEK